MKFWKIRIIGVFVILFSLYYTFWIFSSIGDNLFLAIPFLLASLILIFNSILSVFNHWSFEKPIEMPVPDQRQVKVGIIVPTWGEPINVVINTIQSVFEQRYLHSNITLVVSDDGHRPELMAACKTLTDKFHLPVVYHEPPAKDSPQRQGEGKSGALNSALNFLSVNYPDIGLIETRDADDLTPDKNFLRKCVGLLLVNEKASFVQTIKECVVSEGDPFGNQEPIFYRNTMPAKYYYNSAYSCGSGVVYRKSWLQKIGGFATWNLVEDLYTGMEIFKSGGRGIYLPIVGALGQVAPEDIPNFYKQRGTWAVDALRIFFWRNPIFIKGFDFSQKIQFLELSTFYLLGPAMLVFMVETFIILVFGIFPVNTTLTSYSLHFWPYFLVMEAFLLVKSDGLNAEIVWRSRQTWLGLAPVFTKALFLALFYGPNKKPKYKVTRKFHITGFYFKEVMPQIFLSLLLLFGIYYHIYSEANFTNIDYGSVFWAGFFVLGLSKTIQNSWFGVKNIFTEKVEMIKHFMGLTLEKLLA